MSLPQQQRNLPTVTLPVYSGAAPAVQLNATETGYIPLIETSRTDQPPLDSTGVLDESAERTRIAQAMDEFNKMNKDTFPQGAFPVSGASSASAATASASAGNDPMQTTVIQRDEDDNLRIYDVPDSGKTTSPTKEPLQCYNMASDDSNSDKHDDEASPSDTSNDSPMQSIVLYNDSHKGVKTGAEYQRL